MDQAIWAGVGDDIRASLVGKKFPGVLGEGWFEVLMRATDGYPKRSGGAPTADAEAGMTGVFDDLRAEADDSLVGVVGRMELHGVERVESAF